MEKSPTRINNDNKKERRKKRLNIGGDLDKCKSGDALSTPLNTHDDHISQIKCSPKKRRATATFQPIDTTNDTIMTPPVIHYSSNWPPPVVNRSINCTEFQKASHKLQLSLPILSSDRMNYQTSSPGFKLNPRIQWNVSDNISKNLRRSDQLHSVLLNDDIFISDSPQNLPIISNCVENTGCTTVQEMIKPTPINRSTTSHDYVTYINDDNSILPNNQAKVSCCDRFNSSLTSAFDAIISENKKSEENN